MPYDPNDPSDLKFSRRDFLEVSSGALAAVGAAPLTGVTPQEKSSNPDYDRSNSDPGPTNKLLDEQNPSGNNPPPTDAGGVPPFKYPFSFGHSVFIMVGGLAKSPFANSTSPKPWLASTCASPQEAFANSTGTPPPNGLSCSMGAPASLPSTPMAKVSLPM